MTIYTLVVGGYDPGLPKLAWPTRELAFAALEKTIGQCDRLEIHEIELLDAVPEDLDLLQL